MGGGIAEMKEGGTDAEISLTAEAKLFAKIAAPAVVMQFFSLMQRTVTTSLLSTAAYE